MRRRTALSVVAFLVCSWAGAGQEPSPPSPAAADLFTRKCGSCHTVGKGARIGPDLEGVLERRSRAWVERFVLRPGAMLDTDPVARQMLTQYKGVRMPDLGLSGSQARELVELIAQCSAQPCELAGPFVTVTAAAEPDVARGRDLFLGRRPLTSGGIPCLSCHAVSEAGTAIPGGRLAKDLTYVFAGLGDEGLDAALRNPSFPAMNRIFADHPLSADEVFALRAFLHRSNRSLAVADAGYTHVVTALLGTAGALAALNAAWARRLRGVRSALTQRSREEKRT